MTACDAHTASLRWATCDDSSLLQLRAGAGARRCPAQRALLRRRALAGWVVLILRRHETRISELSAEEAADLGPLLRAVSTALEAVVGCSKTYVVMYAEQPGFEHLHFHVIPRMADFESQQRGGGV